MKKRQVLKKGKYVFTRKPSFVFNLAKNLTKKLKPYCNKMQLAGSIRRKVKSPVDIDVVLIPKNKNKLEAKMKKLGAQYVQGGEHESTWKMKKVKVELYYTTSEEFGACLLAYSSETGSSIGLRVVAKKKGFKLNQHGLWKGGKRVAGRTEKGIYRALGRPWKKPEDR
jgi:DNA polymerase (family 10)